MEPNRHYSYRSDKASAPNGAGKTTLFNCCTRMVRPAAGRISFDGHDLLAEPTHGVIRRGVARTFQNLAIFPTLTVLDNTMVGGHSRARVSFAQALTEAMAKTGYSPKLTVQHPPASGCRRRASCRPRETRTTSRRCSSTGSSGS